MTESEQEQFETAQIAAIVAAAGATKINIADQVTIMLMPLLSNMNPYDDDSVARFAREAAELVNLGIQSMGQVAWSTIAAQLSAIGKNLKGNFTTLAPSRKTPLETAYIRPAGAYRRRMAAGVESIAGTIEQAEEERFQALGGAATAAGRKGKTNAEIEGTDRSPTKGGSKKPATSESGGGSAGKSPSTERASGSDAERPARKNRDVNAEPDDFDAEDAADRAAREAQDRADDEAFDAEQELRRQAALSEEEKNDLLEQVALHEMQVRTERMVNDDLAMANRQASQDAMRASGIKKYRRVLHPELAKYGESCGLCIAASTRIYSVAELMPIHNLCNCETVIVDGAKDPGDQINQEDLGVLYGEAGGTSDGRELKKQRYTVFQHPELGPVLRNANHSQQDIKFSSRETGREE